MYFLQKLATAMLSVALLIPSLASAAVVMPALDISLFSGDSGAVLTATATGYDFDIDATAFSIVSDTSDPIDITNQSFTLHGTYDSASNSFAGTFDVAGGLLAGSFDDLTLVQLSSGSYDFAANLLYDTGSLKGDLTGGRLEGIGGIDSLGAKLGAVAVVPVPAAVWLFGSGLIGLIGIARRKA